MTKQRTNKTFAGRYLFGRISTNQIKFTGKSASSLKAEVSPQRNITFVFA